MDLGAIKAAGIFGGDIVTRAAKNVPKRWREEVRKALENREAVK